jgi:hypothetical protein
METTRALMPRARQDELVVEELQDETLVYDLKSHKARCLNRTAALVWRRCDGRTSVADVAALLQKELEIPADEAVVWMALDRLGRAHLLSEPVALPADKTQYSRREMLRTLRRVAGISLLLPVIDSIVAPLAAMQASSITKNDCANCIGIGHPCSDGKNGQICTFNAKKGQCKCQ